MKTYSHLFEKICTIENFHLAYLNAIKGKTYYRDVIEIEKDRDTYLANLLEEVKSKRYLVSKYTVFNLFTGHKMREIFKLPMKDRIVQHALMIYCEPIFRESFILDTYASIKTKGIHLGLTRVKRALRKYHYKYCLKLDIHKCYPSLNKEILKLKLSEKFLDDDLMDLLCKIIDSCDNGVPIGNYTSLYFNNFYFSEFDHWIKEVKRVKAYFRYCDDMVILSNDKEELHRLLEDIKEYMKTLDVHLKENYQIFEVESRGISFLGYIIKEDYVKIRKATKLNFIHKVSKIDFSKPTERDINVLGSYWGILVHANCRNLWRRYIKTKDFDSFIKEYKCFASDILNSPIRVLSAQPRYSSGKWWTVMKVKNGDKYTTVKTVSKHLSVILQCRLSIDVCIVRTPRGFRFKRTYIMNWTKGNTEWFKPIECINSKKGIYYVNMVPTPFQEEDNEHVNMRYVNFRMDHIPTTSELKELLLDLQYKYDSSNEVNGFLLGDKIVWLDKPTRLGLINSLSIQKETGDTTSRLWMNGEYYTVNIDLALEFLKLLELYAIECYNVTLMHVAEINKLTDRNDILNYDVTTGYPSRISFG